MERILRAFSIQPDESKITSRLWMYSFALGTAKVFQLTAAQALFLEDFAAGDLAYVYIIASVATVAASVTYLRLGNRLPLRSLITANLAFCTVVALVLWLAVISIDARWPALALIVWYQVFVALVSVAFWAAATQVVDIRQGKRIFPIATTGDVIATSLGGLVILSMVDLIGTANLLLIGSAGLAFGIFGLKQITRTHDESFAAKEEQEAGAVKSKAVDWNSPYLRLMMAYFMISAVTFVFLDNAFFDVAERRYTTTETLARFFATYSAVAALVTFFFRSFGAGRLVQRFGLIAGLIGLPLALLIGSSLVISGGILLPALGLVFWFTVMTRLFDKVFRGMQATSFATLYQPLMEKGPAVQTTLDGIVDSIALGLAGLALLGLHRFFDITAWHLSIFLVILCAGWIVVTLRLRREYVATLASVLQRRRIQGQPLQILDSDVLQLVQEELESDHHENVIYALELLEDAEYVGLDTVLVELLEHSSSDVRYQVLARIEERNVAEALPRVREIILNPELPDFLRGRAVRLAAALSEDIFPEVMDALRSEAGEMRRGALVGLLKSGSIEGIVYAGAELLEDLRSDSAPDRIFAAQVLRDAEIPSFYRQAIQLLNDRDIRVRSAAIEAAAKMGHAPLWPVVVDSLREPDLASAASEALIDAGEDAVPSLLYGFDRHADDRSFRLAVLRILGLVKSEAALDRIAELVGSEDRDLRHGALLALSKYGLRATGERKRALKDQVREEVRDVGELYVARQDLLPELNGSPLVRAFTEEIRRGQHRIFLLLAPLFPAHDVLSTWESFSSANRNRRAYALELLENFLSVDERAWMYPVLEDLPGPDRVDRICRAQNHRRMSWKGRISWVLEDSDLSLWTRMCARHEGHAHNLEVSPPTEAEAEILSRAVRLRSVDLFQEMQDHVLAALAPRLQPVELDPGEVVFEKGELGDCMYLVLDGAVRVHDNGTTLAELGANTVFGEFTVLHQGERTASVTADEEGSYLLRLTQTDLYDLIREEATVAQSLIKLIVKRLRQNQSTRSQQGAAQTS